MDPPFSCTGGPAGFGPHCTHNKHVMHSTFTASARCNTSPEFERVLAPGGCGVFLQFQAHGDRGVRRLLLKALLEQVACAYNQCSSTALSTICIEQTMVMHLDASKVLKATASCEHDLVGGNRCCNSKETESTTQRHQTRSECKSSVSTHPGQRSFD